jgi:4-hydroxy-2-oxoheptanedioate aldolase
MYVRKNLMKEKIRAGKTIIGMELWLRDPRLIELMGQAGFDFAHCEYEHVARDWVEMENFVRTCEANGLTPLFRAEQCVDDQPPVNQIIKALKTGFQMIMIPHLESAEAAQKAVDAVKFPPLGKRGLATCDRNVVEMVPNEKTPLDVLELVREANEETMIWGIIETPRAVENIDEILAVEGIDIVGFGHQDYALSAGLRSDDDQQIVEAREKVLDAVKRAGKLMWWNTDTPLSVKEQGPKGVQVYCISVETIHIDRMFRKIVNEAREYELQLA